MQIILYFIWLILIYITTYKVIVLREQINIELLSGSLVALVVSMFQIRPAYQVFTFIAVYFLISVVEFILDIIYCTKR